MTNKYVSVRLILDKLLRHPLLQTLTFETAVDYTVDFLRIVGCPDMYEDRLAQLELSKYRAKLPCDVYQINQVRYVSKGDVVRVFRYNTDSFMCSDMDKDRDGFNNNTDLTYKVQGDIIYTNLESGTIEVSYKAIVVDEEGYPKIPDNSSFTRALEWYIKLQQFTILFDLGQLQPAVLSNAQQQYSWAVGDCESEFKRLSLDQAESFYNSWSTLLLRANEHNKGFKTNGSKEYIKRQ